MRGLAARFGTPLTARAPIVQHSYFRTSASHAQPAEDMAEYQTALATFQSVAAMMATGAAEAQTFGDMSLPGCLNHRQVPVSLRREIMAWWSISGSASPATVGVS